VRQRSQSQHLEHFSILSDTNRREARAVAHILDIGIEYIVDRPICGWCLVERRERMFGSEPANDVYASIDFKEPHDFYNQPAPEPWVAALIGLVLSVVTVVYWYFGRWRPVMASVRASQHTTHLLNMRVIMSTIADNDDPIFTMVRVSSQSLLFLAGFQVNYLLTLVVMCVYYTVISVTDSLRVIISLNEADRLQDLVEVSKRDRRFLASTLTLMAKSNGTTNVAIDLKTQNVYEDISRNMTVVMLVFLTQSVLIAFVVVDAFGLETHTVMDKTNNVPIVGTLGSYLVYVLGIFMQCVYILGPKTNFGTSEQNPHFWLQLLLAAKKYGCQCSWTTDEDGVKHTRVLRPGDWNLWFRFLLSFLINGVGFHVLVHALPIQVAGQSNLTGIVIRAVGMMYLVDLDDAPGTVLKLMEYSNRTETAAAVDLAKTEKKVLPFGDLPQPTVANDVVVNKSDLLLKRYPPNVVNDITSSFSTDVPTKSMTSSKSDDNEEKCASDYKEDCDDCRATSAMQSPDASPRMNVAQPAEEALMEQAKERAENVPTQLQPDLHALALSSSPAVGAPLHTNPDKQANATATANVQSAVEPTSEKVVPEQNESSGGGDLA
jgi:hypothetical protein